MTPFFRTIICAAAVLLAPHAAFGQDFAGMGQDNPVSWSAAAKQVDGDIFEVAFTADVQPSWHIYDMGPYDGGPIPTSFDIRPDQGAELVGTPQPSAKPTVVMDEIFNMQIGYFEGRATFVQRVRMKAAKAVLTTTVEWMACNDQSCMPPDYLDLTVEISHPGYKAPVSAQPAAQPATQQVTQPAAAVAAPTAITPAADVIAGQPLPDIDGDSTEVAVAGAPEAQPPVGITVPAAPAAGDLTSEGGSLWAFILEAMLWGLAALLTPCVFPMIPMTISFFLKNQGSPARGRFMATMYGVFIVALYTLPIVALIVISNAVGGSGTATGFFNWLATHWVPNVIFFVVFMIFAASFFGAFEITLPSGLVNKSDRGADRGGLIGTFFMALTLVLVSFSCTGPIVGTVLIKSARGEVWTPVLTMLAFSVTFALPFVVFALFPSLMNKLRSGSWLNSVKVVLGFVELALGLKFLSVADQTYHWGILDREVYLAIWIVVFALLGFYLLGKLRFRHDDEVKHIAVTRILLSVVTFSFVVYMIPGMWGAPLKALSGYLPPMSTQDFVIGQGGAPAPAAQETSRSVKYSDILHLPHGLNGFFELAQAQEYAESVGKPLFIDITGHGCVNCREMEQKVWADPRVLSLLRDKFVVVALYTDDKLTAAPEDWIVTDTGRELTQIGRINTYIAKTLFGVAAQPFYIITGRDGERLADHRYDLSVDNFVEFLNEGAQAYAAAR